MKKSNYLRHRPFLVIENIIVPPAGWKTERKGWRQHQTYIEKPRVVRRISHTTMLTATVIIDMENNRVVKNRLKTDATMFDDEVLSHYRKKYADAWPS